MQLRLKQNRLFKVIFNLAILIAGFILNFAHPALAIDASQWNECRQELNNKGYSLQRQNDFCRRPTPAQWTCSQIILKKFHSLELAQDTCFNVRPSEIHCFNEVLNRNYEPHVAKRVCRLK